MSLTSPRSMFPLRLLVVVAAALPALRGLAHAGSAQKANRAESLLDKFLSTTVAELSPEDSKAIQEHIRRAEAAPKDAAQCGARDLSKLFAMSAQKWSEIKAGIEWQNIEISFTDSVNKFRSKIDQLKAEMEAAKKKGASRSATASQGPVDQKNIFKKVFDKIIEDDDIVTSSVITNAIRKELNTTRRVVLNEVEYNEACSSEDGDRKDQLEDVGVDPSTCKDALTMLKAYFTEAEPDDPAKEMQKLQDEIEEKEDAVAKCQATWKAVQNFQKEMEGLYAKQNEAFVRERLAKDWLDIYEANLTLAGKVLEAQKADLTGLVNELNNDMRIKQDLGDQFDQVTLVLKETTQQFEATGEKLNDLGKLYIKTFNALKAANKFKADFNRFVTTMLAWYRKTVHNPIKAVLARLTRETTEEQQILFEASATEGALEEAKTQLFNLETYCRDSDTLTALRNVKEFSLCNHTPSFLCENNVILKPQDNFEGLEQILKSQITKAAVIISRLREHLIPDDFNEQDGIAEFMTVFVNLKTLRSYVQMWLDEDCEKEDAPVGANTRGALTKVMKELETLEGTLNTKKKQMNEKVELLEKALTKTKQDLEHTRDEISKYEEKLGKNNAEKQRLETLRAKTEEWQAQLIVQTKELRSNYDELHKKLENSQNDIVEEHQFIRDIRESAAAALVDLHNATDKQDGSDTGGRFTS